MKFTLLLLFLSFSACSVKEYTLFQEPKPESVSIAPQELNVSFNSKIVPDDILTIDIYNMNRKSNIMVNEQGVSIRPDNDYIVYNDGTIILPLLNSVSIQGYTIQEVNKYLTKRYSEFLKSPYVKARIKNHRIYVLGEVNKQGVIAIEGETISVIEALAKSGGLTDHAIRDRIRIIKKVNGKYMLTTLNLNQFSTLNHQDLMLKHNTILYIEPKGTKAVRVAINDYLPIIQAISSVLGTFLTIDYLTN